jgi:hypothetical protein
MRGWHLEKAFRQPYIWLNDSARMKTIFTLLIALTTFTAMGQKTLHLYGGKDREEYLGCLTCNQYEASSVWNAYGTYGFKYNAKSIWNKYGIYGSAHSNTSPFNTFATEPPAIMDKDGEFYGYFTINVSKGQRVLTKLTLEIYKHYDSIREDVSGWYEKICK